jgi:hypothetical protein
MRAMGTHTHQTRSALAMIAIRRCAFPASSSMETTLCEPTVQKIYLVLPPI